jgi:superfamily I DNA/RNA helicase
MNFTSEQLAIIRSSGNIKINAVAGSGKTSTLLGYAKERKDNGRILYIAFNRSVKLEAARKFSILELPDVKVETAHSLAYSYIVAGSHYKVNRNGGYKTHEIVEILGLKESKGKHTEFILANHINRYLALFCNSDKQKVQEIEYASYLSDEKAVHFANNFREEILKQTRILLAKMDKSEIDITHDFYLKKFHLSAPSLRYDYILFDEAQDASDAMLDVVRNQKGTIVIVGDTHQQIYGWRFAVNSLEKMDYSVFHLTRSFRFHPEIAALAGGILQWKSHLGMKTDAMIYGLGPGKPNGQKAVLARTNVGLLSKAVELLIERNQIGKIYFEGRIESYTYADDGASVYDVLNLFLNNHQLIKDKLIASMKHFQDLEDYIEKTEDAPLRLMVEIVKKYQGNLPLYIRQIKEAHVENHEKDKAEMIFSTVHKCKGLEYDEVTLVDDFISEDKIIKLAKESKENRLFKDKIAEEINLLYVAVTRTRNILNIPEQLMPASRINIIRKQEERNIGKHIPELMSVRGKYSQSIQQYDFLGPLPKNAGKPWNDEEDDLLTVLYCEGKKGKAMSKKLGRSEGAIRARIEKLELRELYG